MKPRLLLMCQVSPPMTGAALVGRYVTDSRQLQERYNLTVIPIRMADRVAALGAFTPNKILISLSLFTQLIAELAQRHYAAVYFSPAIYGAAFFRDLVLVTIARAFGRKRILHIHMRGVVDAYQRSRFFRACYRLMFADAEVIHLAPSLFGDLVDLVPEARQHTVANGIPARAFPKERNATTHEQPTVLYLSNLMLAKGPLDLLEAGLRLLRSGLRFSLVFVGAFYDAEVERRIATAASEFPEAIVLRGPLYGEEKERVQASADVFALPSWNECQSLALIEAMAAGLAILTSRVGGTPDLICDGVTGLLHDVRDIAGIEHGLRRLVEDAALRRRLGTAARDVYLENYTLDHFERRLVETIDRIVCKPA